MTMLIKGQLLMRHMVNHCIQFEVSTFSHSRDILGEWKFK